MAHSAVREQSRLYGFVYSGTGLSQPGNGVEFLTRFLTDAMQKPLLRDRVVVLSRAVDAAVAELTLGESFLTLTSKDASWAPHDTMRRAIGGFFSDQRLVPEQLAAYESALAAAKRAFWCEAMETHLASLVGVKC